MQKLVLLLGMLVLLGTASGLWAQALPDSSFHCSIAHPHFQHLSPVVGIDGGHHNLHQLHTGFAGFAEVLRADGYQVQAWDRCPDARVDLWVVANALHPANQGNWTRPIYQAFSSAEIDSIVNWVHQGGALLLVADHMPFAGAIDSLAQRFGVHYADGFVMGSSNAWPPERYLKHDGTLFESPLSKGVDTLAGFTGSSLQITGDALPLGRFPEGHSLWIPEVAWQFDTLATQQFLDSYYMGAYLKAGKGRVVFLTEAAMLTAQLLQGKYKVGLHAPVAPDNTTFLRNTVKWLVADLYAAEIGHRLLAKMKRDFEASAFTQLAESYSADARMYGFGQSERAGKSAIRQYWAALQGQGEQWNFIIKEAEFAQEGILLVCHLHLSWRRATGEVQHAYSNAMLSLHTEEGQYKISRDFYFPIQATDFDTNFTSTH